MNPKKFWKKLLATKSSKLSSRSSGQHSASDPNAQASTTGHTIGHAVCPTSVVASASVGTSIPLQSQDLHQFPPASADKDQLNTSEIETSPSADKKSRWKATAYSGAKMVLEVARESSDVFVPLKSVAGGLSALLNQYDRFISNKDDVQRLILRVQSLATSLTGPPKDGDIKEIARRSQLKRDLSKVMETLDPISKQSSISGFLNNADQAAEIASLVENIRDAIIDYQTSLQQNLNDNTYTLIESTDILLLDKLRRSDDAGYLSGDRQKCMRGTRVKVLETIENWVDRKTICQVYWLNGIAGSGKTTIAHSLAERVFARGDLGSSFYCSRDFADRRNLHFIFPTLAFQLAYKYPTFRAHLVNRIKLNPVVDRGSLENQLKMLLVEPLLSTGLSTVIIIDALDECDDKEPASAILSLLSRVVDQIPLVKFFITGRPEPRIRAGFRLPGLHPRTEVLLLHEVERGDVDEDIKLFLEFRMKELIENRSDINVTTPWPSSEHIRIVTSKAGGLFIYASTVIKFLASTNHTPQERLQLITSMPHSSAYEGKSEIDPLYTCMLENGCADVDASDSKYLSRLLVVVGSVVLLCEPISVASLASFLELDAMDIRTSIRSLHSVLLVPDSDSRPIRVFHKSFPDYITDSERCRDSRFYVDSQVHNIHLAICCFESMKTWLKEGMFGLPQYAMNDDIEDLSTRRKESLSEVLVYACRFWAKHLCLSSPTGEGMAQILNLLSMFIQGHLLQWLEVLSVVKDIRGAVHSLLDVERWLLEVESSNDSLVDSIRECLRFVLYSFDGIEQSAAHIYNSALLWPPASSFVRSQYQTQLRTQAKLLNGIDNSWDACIRAIQLGRADYVRSVAFSHVGDLIVGCSGSVVKISDAATGVCLATLSGHTGTVYSIAFSPDGVIVASGAQDGMVIIWDVQTGALVRRLEGHSGEVNCVVFSPTGSMVASGADDRTVRIWNLVSGDCDRILEGHSNWVRSVCWLGTNQVVSGCNGGKVKVWDVLSGDCLNTFAEHSDVICSVASSPDGSRIASGSEDETIQVYDARTGDVLQTISASDGVMSVCFAPDGDKIVYASDSTVIWDLVKQLATFELEHDSWSVAFSPDGNYIAAGSYDGFVRVFKVENTEQDHGLRDQHSKAVRCISFAADGRMIASGSDDTTVKLWDAMTGSCVQTFHGHSLWIRSVAFSPDSLLIASGSNDWTVRIWSVHPGDVTSDPCWHEFHGHSDWVRSVAFSPDSSLVASGSDDKTVRIWSVQDRNMVVTLKGHNDWVTDVRFSPDGRRIASISDFQEIILWDVEKWAKLATWPSPVQESSDSRVFFSADGSRIILESRGIVKKWNIQSSVEYSSQHTTGSQTSEPSSKAISLPMVLVPISDEVYLPHDDVGPYRCPRGSEWILDQQDRRVCWIPADRRCSDSHGTKIT